MPDGAGSTTRRIQVNHLILMLFFLASTGWAAPSIQSSQFTAFNGNSVNAAVPAGAANEVLIAFVALPCTKSGGLSGLVSGWVVISNSSGTCGVVSLKRVSDGTETSVTVNLTNSGAGNALVLRVADADINSLVVGSAAVVSGSPNAPATPDVPGSNQNVLWLTYANAMRGPVLAPSGYSNVLSASNGAYPQNDEFMVSEKSNTVSWPYGEDAGAWTLSASSISRAQTIGIR